MLQLQHKQKFILTVATREMEKLSNQTAQFKIEG